MKKLNAMFMLLALTTGLFAQFTTVNWVNFANHPADFNAEPFAKKSVTAMKAGYTINVADLDEIGLPELWDKLGTLGVEPQGIANMVVNDGTATDLYDLDGDATLGSQFKAVWDDDFLYVLLKYVDVNAQLDPAQIRYEICYQLADPDRYQAGYDAAADVAQKNQQYGGFVELGAGKAVFDASGITGSQRTKGQDGSWASALGAAGSFVYKWSFDGDGTLWAVVGMAFEDYLIYMTDPTGAFEAANYTSLDPTVKTKISFDVQSNGYPGESANTNRLAYFWSSTVNDGYALVYYNGYLDFSTETFSGVATHNLSASSKSAFIYDNVLRFKGFENPVNIEVYSVVGQRVLAAQNVSTLNVSDLNNGIYIVKVAGEKQAFKVVKQ